MTLWLVAGGCRSDRGTESEVRDQKPVGVTPFEDVLGDPDAYHGKRVALLGVVTLKVGPFGDFENALRDPLSGRELRIVPDRPGRTEFERPALCTVQGTFDAQDGTAQQGAIHVESISACTTGEGRRDIKPGTRDSPALMSMVRLLSQPERYHGWVVRVDGFVRLEFEGTAVYLTKDDLEYRNYPNALWLSLSDDADRDATTDGDACTVTGTFDATARGHLGLFTGSIREADVRQCRGPHP